MQLKRIFTTEGAKGTKNYLNTQKKYEILRTVLYFSISLSLFIAGYIQTGEKANLLSIVAVLGFFSASKSMVGAVMFLRFKSCGETTAAAIEEHSEGLSCLYDMVFTSYKKNFVVSHMAVSGNTICGFAENPEFDENAFRLHIDNILKLDGHKDIVVKIFTDLPKYLQRLEQMRGTAEPSDRVSALIATLKSVVL